MNPRDKLLRDGACACLAVAARRGSVALEKALSGFTATQRELVPDGFIQQLRVEAAQHERSR